MSLPITTRTVTIEAPTATDDDPLTNVDTWATVAADVRAHIAGGSGSRQGNGREQVDATLYVEPDVPVTIYCRVTDHATGFVYAVQTVQPFHGVGLDHVRAGLTRIQNDA